MTRRVEADEDCMGNPTYPYWVCTLTCSDGTQAFGSAATEELAKETAQRNQQQHETYLRMTCAEQLQVLVAGDLLDADQRAAIRLLTKLVLALQHRQEARDLLGKI